MLIQCQTCDSKYRLNLERIPDRKTFIKCKKCNAPIYIDPREAELETEVEPPPAARESDAAAAIPPTGPIPPVAPAPRAEPEGEPEGDALVVVRCDNCEARYRVPAQGLRKPGLKLKCTRCGHMFPVPEGLVGSMEPPAEPPPTDEAAAPDFFPAAEQAEPPAQTGPPARTEPPAQTGPPARTEPPAQDEREQPMPLPDDSRMDSMFDDLQVDEATAGAPPPSEAMAAGISDDSEQAYLDAVTFGEEGGSYRPPTAGSISDEQKSRFFLKPNLDGAPAEAELPSEEQLPRLVGGSVDGEGESAVETPGDPHPPHLPSGETAGANTAAEHSPVEALEAPPFESEFPEETGMSEPTDVETSLPPLPVAQVGDAHGANQAVPNQEPQPSTSENRNFMLMVAALVIVVVGSAFWGFWLWTQPGSVEPYVILDGTPQELAVTNTREGYFVTNKPSGEKLYVITGQLKNGFAAEERVSWVRLKGIAYTNSGQVTREGDTYVGNVLNDDQLANWELSAIRAYYGYTNGRNDINFDIPGGKSVPFQIVMKGGRQPVARTEARVLSFMRRGQPVFLEHF